MDLYQRLKEAATSLDEAAFVGQHDGCYLLGKMPEAQPNPIPFVTRIYRVSTDRLPSSPEEPAVPSPPERLWKIEKSEQNAWKRRISVGRATNNDIVIRHRSVSKLHAHFHAAPAADAARPDGPLYLLTDTGSSNGTTVNGALLTPDVSVPVRNRDRIVFGAVSGRFFDARTLHAELSSHDWF